MSTMRLSNKNKSKKKASTSSIITSKEKIQIPPDLSHLRVPFDTSIFNLDNVIGLLNTATDEVQRYLKNECLILYECKICRTLFRSIANFTLHKKKFCTESFNNKHVHCSCVQNHIYEELHDSVEESYDTNAIHRKKNLNDVLEMLSKKQEEPNRKETDPVETDVISYKTNNINVKIQMENVEGNISGMFQTITNTSNKVNDSIKTEVMEIHNIFDKDEAVLGPDGKIISSSKSDIICQICNQKFLTRKTLLYHTKYKHNENQLVYRCTECENYFANPWGVIRHLLRIHKKPASQVKKIRNQINNSGIAKNVVNNNTSTEVSPKTTNKLNDEDKQWMENFEGDIDFQMCGGCGKRFERKAALNSHSQICVKRKAICETSKLKNVKSFEKKKKISVKNNEESESSYFATKRSFNQSLDENNSNNVQGEKINCDLTLDEKRSCNQILDETRSCNQILDETRSCNQILDETRSYNQILDENNSNTTPGENKTSCNLTLKENDSNVTQEENKTSCNKTLDCNISDTPEREIKRSFNQTLNDDNSNITQEQSKTSCNITLEENDSNIAQRESKTSCSLTLKENDSNITQGESKTSCNLTLKENNSNITQGENKISCNLTLEENDSNITQGENKRSCNQVFDVNKSENNPIPEKKNKLSVLEEIIGLPLNSKISIAKVSLEEEQLKSENQDNVSNKTDNVVDDENKTIKVETSDKMWKNPNDDENDAMDAETINKTIEETNILEETCPVDEDIIKEEENCFKITLDNLEQISVDYHSFDKMKSENNSKEIAQNCVNVNIPLKNLVTTLSKSSIAEIIGVPMNLRADNHVPIDDNKTSNQQTYNVEELKYLCNNERNLNSFEDINSTEDPASTSTESFVTKDVALNFVAETSSGGRARRKYRRNQIDHSYAKPNMLENINLPENYKNTNNYTYANNLIEDIFSTSNKQNEHLETLQSPCVQEECIINLNEMKQGDFLYVDPNVEDHQTVDENNLIMSSEFVTTYNSECSVQISEIEVDSEHNETWRYSTEEQESNMENEDNFNNKDNLKSNRPKRTIRNNKGLHSDFIYDPVVKKTKVSSNHNTTKPKEPVPNMFKNIKVYGKKRKGNKVSKTLR